jgi:hypothetical protein
VEPSKDSLRILQAHRIVVAMNFIRTIIARQRIVADIDSNWEKTGSGDEAELPTQRVAYTASRSTINSYSVLARLNLLDFFNFQTVLHLSTAGHTLLACMLKNRDLQPEYMDLVTKCIE